MSRKNDPRLRYSTVLKVRRLEAKIDALIKADIEAYERRQREAFSAAGDGMRRTQTGALDRRTKAYRAATSSAADPNVYKAQNAAGANGAGPG